MTPIMKTKSKFTPPDKQGFTVKDGKLYEFNKDSVEVTRAWPPARYCKTKKKPFWRCAPIHESSLRQQALEYSIRREQGRPVSIDAKINIEDTPSKREKIEKLNAKRRKWIPAIAAFYDLIPLEAREKMFCRDDHAWNICSFYARCPGASEFMRNAPAIGYMLSNFPVFRKKLSKRWEAVRRIMPKPRRKILAWLGWPDSEAVAKLLSKIEYDACFNKELLMLRALIRKEPEIIKPLSHLKSIDYITLDIIFKRSYRSKASWRFLNELSELYRNAVKGEGSAYNSYKLFKDTLFMERLLMVQRGPIQSITHLRKRHDRAVEDANRHEISEMDKSKQYPVPPVPAPPATEDFEIIPLDSPVKLYLEAREQHNCVFSVYNESVQNSNGNIYIYSLRKPERATVLVRFDYENNTFWPAEVKGPMNTEVSTETISKLSSWLNACGLKSKSSGIDDVDMTDRILPAFPLTVPGEDGFHISHLSTLANLLAEMRRFGVEENKELISFILKGQFYIFLMDVPELAMLLVNRGKGGAFSYSARRMYGGSALRYETEARIDQWLDEAVLHNLRRGGQGQMSFDFMEIKISVQIGQFHEIKAG